MSLTEIILALLATATVLQTVVIVILFVMLYRRRTSQSAGDTVDAASLLNLASGVEITAENVLSAADRHSNMVEAAMSKLTGMKGMDDKTSAKVSSAVTELLESNQRLKGQLSDAKQQLEDQHSEMDLLRNESLTDPLTKLPNRRAIDMELSRTHATWSRTNRPYALIMIDIDHFKRINDTHGHDAGDDALRSFASYVRRFLRTTDFVGRYGGEEFLVLMPETSLREAVVAAERLRVSVQDREWEFAGKKIPITACVGIALPRPHDRPSKVVKRADAALYAAKQAGRNRCYFSQDTLFLPAKKILDIASPKPQVEASPFIKSKIEQRKQPRRAYRCVQYAAKYDGETWPSDSSFFEIECIDISAGGISFLSRSRVDSKRLLMTLGQAGDDVYVHAEVVYARAVIFHGTPMFRVGCRFLRKIAGSGKKVDFTVDTDVSADDVAALLDDEPIEPLATQ